VIAETFRCFEASRHPDSTGDRRCSLRLATMTASPWGRIVKAW
jgi:hypothetical protein